MATTAPAYNPTNVGQQQVNPNAPSPVAQQPLPQPGMAMAAPQAQPMTQQTPGGLNGSIGQTQYSPGTAGLTPYQQSRQNVANQSGSTNPSSGSNANATQWNTNIGSVDTGVDNFRQFGDQMYEHSMGRLNGQMDQQNAALSQSLVDRGLQPGTAAYNSEMNRMDTRNNDLMSATALGAEQLGLQAQNQYFGQQSANNQFELGQANQNYGQQFGYDQLANSLAQTQIGANASMTGAMASAGASRYGADQQNYRADLANALGTNQLNEGGRQFDINNITQTQNQDQNYNLGLMGQYNNAQNTALNQFNAQQGANNQWFNQNGSMLSNAPGVIFNANQGYTGNQVQANQNNMNAIAGDNAMMASLAGGMIPSDERLKENIELVDNVDGYDVYEFDYIDKSIGNERYRGVMAQDVIKRQPDAIRWFNGFMGVIYDMIPVDMEVVA